ncbi:MAG: ABC transporter permease [Cytophagaceae bacterium]
MKTSSKFLWLFIMAWRDARKNRLRLLMFVSSIVLGISALVGIRSFRDALEVQINQEAKTLLGADLVISSVQPITGNTEKFLDSIGNQKARESSFASMVFFPKTENLRLANVRALEGGFPFYGTIETTPSSAFKELQKGRYALVDQSLLLQFNARPGDSIRIGDLYFTITGQLGKIPGQAGIAATVAPVVYIPFQYLDQTGLNQKGSRINYKFYYRFNPGTDVAALTESIKPRLEKEKLSADTLSTIKERTTNAYGDLSTYLNLLAFVALILGCLGVASSVHTYVREKISSVAILRCLGVKGYEAFMIYLIQIKILGLLGATIGVIAGALIQMMLPRILGDFLVLQPEFMISWPAVFIGLLTGISMAVLFALLPLLSVRKISPLLTLRFIYEKNNSWKDPLQWLACVLILSFVFAFGWYQTGSYKTSAIFTGALSFALLILALIALSIMWLIKKVIPAASPYPIRQGFANLFRPNNQTVVLVTTIGIGIAIIASLYFVKNILIHQLSISESGKEPNMILFDIQPEQKNNVASFTRESHLPVIQLVPLVTMRLEDIKGKSRSDYEKDTLHPMPEWIFNREYRVTFRDTLSDTEKLLEGKINRPVRSLADTIFISIDEGYAKTIKVKMGDPLTFNVQGMPVKTIIGSIRKVNWRKIQSNFLIVFPSGVLEKAPQFHILTTRTSDVKQSAAFQLALIKRFPNVSVVDLSFILSTVKKILQQVSLVIEFMASFSIITGILVLGGSIILSRYQRMQESVLLRTLGASGKQILTINSLEYFFLGSVASLTGIVLAMAVSWSFAKFALEAEFSLDIPAALILFLSGSLLTTLIGILNSRKVLTTAPLEVLRTEA